MKQAMGLEKVETYLAARESDPNWFEWTIAIFAAIVQQSAFISIPLYMGNPTLLIREDQSATNTIAVAISLLTISLLCVAHFKSVGRIIAQNALSLAFVVLIFGSVIWSIHPDISFRRCVGYVLTLLVAAYFTARFDIEGRMRILSYSFAIAALGSILFVVLFPGDGIMSVAELSGNWRGVFPHKNVLGPTMAVAVFVELFLLAGPRRSAWHLGLLALFLFLVWMSRSVTGLSIAAIYVIGACVFALGRLSFIAGSIASIVVATASSMLVLVFCFDRELFLGMLGKDSTLTGRTDLWSNVAVLIGERPMLGYGYRAMWVLTDPLTIRVNNAVGGWGPPSSHNSFIELALQLGFLGLGLILLIIAVAFVRAFKCWAAISGQLGKYSLMFFAAIMLGGLTEETIGQNQVIAWLVFNILFFSCGAELHGRQPGLAVAVSRLHQSAPVNAFRRI